MLKSIRWIISLIVVFVLFSLCIINFNKDISKEVVRSVNDIIDINKIEDKLSINKIEEIQKYYGNTDIKAVISIDGVDDFSYPVVQTSDNDYYLNHNYYKEYDSYGSIYADYRIDLDNSKKILIYGHSSIKRNTPFNSLEKYYDQDYYKDHKYITLETKTKIYRYEIFSVYVETSDFTYMNMNFDSTDTWYLHLKELQDKSLYDTNINLNIDDDILIMQTCSTNSNYKKYKSKYLLVISRRVNE